MTSKLDVTFSRAATNDKAVFLTIDKNYLPFALFTINQLAVMHPHRDFDFCILTTDTLPSHPLIDEHSVRICKLDAQKITLNFPSSDLIPIAAYLRFYGSRALGDDYRRILYLDADLFMRRGDIGRLLDIDMGQHPMAGARDPVQFRRKGYIPNDMKALGFGYFKYLSAGVQLIDTARYNALEIGERAIDIAVTQPEKMLVYDQTAINAIVQGDWAELPLTWNWLYNFRSLYFTELYDPAILHFVGRRKPWKHVNGEYPAHYTQAYRDFFADHFPELSDTIPPSRPPSQAKWSHVRFFVRHILDLWRFVPQMDRFADDFDIKL